MGEVIPEHSKHPDVIVIGASAGGVEALLKVIPQLPGDLKAVVFIVVHIPAQAQSLLAELLDTRSALHVKHAVHGEAIEYGTVFVAPPDHHMMVEHNRILLSKGPKENRVRPAIDPLFRTAVELYQRRVIAVLLTGTLDDGTAGLMAVHKFGGLRVVQDPDTAVYDQMPRNAIEKAGADVILPLDALPAFLIEAINKPIYKRGELMSDPNDTSTLIVQRDIEQQELGSRNGMTSTYSCPDCGGILWEIDEAGLIRFRCHVGHAYSADNLYYAQDEVVEGALWSAVRSLTEKGILSRQLATRMREQGNTSSADRFEEKAASVEQHITVIRNMLLGGKSELDEPSVGP